jgi:hypothetical protein|tara:strand:+ start:98 stop:1012 length:915 start_codon:yes stop_codon:yes gene_type:complete
MKKIIEFIFLVLFLSFFVSSLGNSKIIQFGNNFELDVPNNYSYLKLTEKMEGVDIDEMEKYGIEGYFLGDKKLMEEMEHYFIYGDFDTYFTQIQKKLERKARNSSPNQIIKYFLRILKKDNIQSLTFVMESGTFTKEEFINELSDFGFDQSDLDEFDQYSSEELKKFNKEIKSTISDAVLNLGAQSYKISSFKFSKDKSNDFFASLKSRASYSINELYTFKTNDEAYVTFKNNTLYFIYRICFADCNNYKNFKKMIKPISDLGKTVYKNNNLNFINQLEKLNELYKSGALTKEEFEKAKKKILN